MSFAAAFLTNLVRVSMRRMRRGPRHPAWGKRLEATVETLRADGDAKLAGSLASWRASQEAAAANVPMARGVRESVARCAGREALVLRPTGPARGTFLYLHGGGYATGSPRTHRALVSRLVAATGAAAWVLDYRLAPEHPFPAAIDDATAALSELGERGPTFVAGDSAGGGLALAAMCRLRDAGAPLPRFAVLLCPWVDLGGTHPSIEENLPYDWGDRRTLDFYREQYGADPMHPLASPIHASLSGLPPLFVQSGDAELLRDECRRLADNARRDGVEVAHREWPGMVHDFQIFAPVVPESRAAIAEIGAWVRPRLAR
jgi:acetyl esterase/lipase